MVSCPLLGTGADKMAEISARQIERLQGCKIDGLVLYDIQDEASRTSEARPFPFMETSDALSYSREYLPALSVPKIIYRSVGKYSRAELSEFLRSVSPTNELTVFVGASSVSQSVSMSVADAYASASKSTLLLCLEASPFRKGMKSKVMNISGCSVKSSRAVRSLCRRVFTM